MKESDQDAAPAARASYGAGVTHSDLPFGRVTTASETPVHHNVDAPFRPLVPFVPPDYWDRKQAPPKRSLSEIAVSFLVAMKRAGRRFGTRTKTDSGR